MNEHDYVNASNLARLRVIDQVLAHMIPTKYLPAESIKAFEKWTHRMVLRHFGLVDPPQQPT